MKIYLCISIDCECDKGPGWICRRPLSFNGVMEGMMQRLHPLFLQYRAKPTYLLSAEVMRDERSASWLATTSGEAELGSHLHGEFVDPDSFTPTITSAFQCNYPPEIEARKMANITALFRSVFGRPPRAFRAGRFGIGPHSLGILHREGYWVDSSVTPYADWRSAGGPSFRGAPTQPYWPKYSRPEQPQANSRPTDILEIPVTMRASRIAALPFVGGRASGRWLRPTWGSAASLVSVAKEEIDRSVRSGDRPVVLNCMFHNVEVVPGVSPYAANEAAARSILKKVEELLRFAAREAIPVIGLSELREIISGAEAVSLEQAASEPVWS
jgi:hypothetical protein